MQNLDSNVSWRDRFNQIRIKLPLITILLVLVCVVITAIAVYMLVARFLLQTEIKNISTTAEVTRTQLEVILQDIEADVQFLAKTPPIQGIIRAQQQHGVDTLGHSNEQLWRERLAQIFDSILQSHPAYYQTRYIGFADNGRELVRAERTADGIMTEIRPGQLQQKGERDYMRQGGSLNRATPYLSDINLNREHGRIVYPYQPTLRVAIPVFTPEHESFGIIIINVDVDILFSELAKNIDKQYTLFIVNKHNDYLYHAADTVRFGSEIGKPGLFQRDYPAIARDIAVLEEKNTFSPFHLAIQDDIAYGISRIDHIANSDIRNISIILSTPLILVEQVIETSRNAVIFTVFAILLIVSLLSWLMAERLVRRLVGLNKAVMAFRHGFKDAPLPTASNDELGQVAEEFKRMRQEITSYTDSLAESELRHRSIINNVVDSVIVIDDTGHITAFNASAEKMFDWKADEVIGRNVNIIMPAPHAEQHDQYIQNYLDTGNSKIIGKLREVEAKRKDGSLVPVEISVTKMVLGHKVYFTGVLRDITERKEHEQILLAREQALVRSNAELEKFAYVASHDLQEPLRKVETFSNLLLNKYENILQGSGLEYVERMSNAAARMRSLINDLLKLSRISSQAVEFVPVNLDELLNDVLSDLEIAIREKQASISCGELPSIDGDALQLRQLFQNLIGNALKYQRPEVPVEITIESEQVRDIGADGIDQDMCRITITDNGIGFEQEYAERIFEMFQRLHGRQEYTGTGVGLAIVRRIVERHGGSIRAESAPGQGSRFIILLPMRHEAEK